MYVLWKGHVMTDNDCPDNVGKGHLYSRDFGGVGEFVCVHCGKVNRYHEFMKGWKAEDGRNEK